MEEVCNKDEPAETLWCVELVPKRRPLGKSDLARVAELAKLLPEEPGGALVWMGELVRGFLDQRVPQLASDRRRLVVSKDKWDGARRAREETNEFWRGKVRPVRIV